MKDRITHKITALWMACLLILSGLSFTACGGDEEDTNQYTGGISLNVFGPCPVARGGVLRFLGSGMNQVTGIELPGSGEITDIEVISDTEIRITVPQTAQPGLVVLHTPTGDITTKTEITFTEPISLDKVAPTSVKPGDVITLTGEYLTLIREVIFTDNVIVNQFESQSRKELKVKVPLAAKSGMVIISDGAEIPNWIYSKESLTVALPTYTSSSAEDVKAGDELTFTGENLNWIETVRFQGAEVSELTVSADGTTLTATVPAKAQSGAVELVTYSGIAIEAGEITTALPTELAVSPTPVKNGANLTITGKDLDLVESVAFPNASAATQPTSITATEIVVKVDAKAQDGDLTLTLLNGETVTVPYTTLKPTIMAFDPPALTAGEEVTITGTDLDLVTSVIFAGEGTPTVTIDEDNYVDETTLKITVPLAAATSAPQLKLLNGMTVDTDVTLDITPATDPVIATMPDATIPGDMITLTGSNLNYVESFYFGNTKVEYYDERSATTVTLQVPKALPYADYKIKMVNYEGAEFLSEKTIKVQSPEILMWKGEVPMLWSAPGQVTIYRNVPDGLSDITNVGLTVGSKLIIYYTTTDDGYQIQINNSNWSDANWGVMHTAGFYPDAPAGTNVKCEITLNAVQLDELLNLSASWGGSSCLNLQGAGCTLLKVCVLP